MDSRIIPGLLATAAVVAIGVILLAPRLPPRATETVAAVEPSAPAVTVMRAGNDCLLDTVFVTGWLQKGQGQDAGVHLEAEVPEVQVSKLAVGQLARIDVAGVGTVTGKVGAVSPDIDRATHLGHARIDFFNADSRLRVLGFGRGTVETGRDCGVTIPLSAILYRPDGTFVQVVRDGRVETHRIEVGLVQGPLAAVQSGVAQGDLVVTLAGTFLRDGDAARPVIAGDTPLVGGAS